MDSSTALGLFLFVLVSVGLALHLVSRLAQRAVVTNRQLMHPKAWGRLAWRLCQLLLSFAVLALLVAVLWGVKATGQWTTALLAAAFLGLLATLPWVPWHRLQLPGRLTPVICALTALLLALMSYGAWMGHTQLPMACSGRRRWFCDLLNTLHAAGGPVAVGGLYALLMALALLATLRSLQSALRDERPR